MNTASAPTNRFINLVAVTIPPRQRREMSAEALENLKISISSEGLLHAPVLRRDGDTNEFKLVAGERRLRAMKALHDGKIPFFYNRELVPSHCIPFTDIEATDDIAALTIELNENLMREDLSWQDKVRAQADLQRLRSAQNPKQTSQETAKEIVANTGKGAQHSVAQEISRAMLTAEFLDDPEVAKAKNERWAWNMAARKMRDEFASQLSKDAVSEHTFIHGDSTGIVPTLSERFNCFIIDPPYGVRADTFHPGNGPTEQLHQYEDTPEHALDFSITMLSQCTKVATEDAHLWMFCDIDLFLELRKSARELGWTVFRTPLIWNKGSTGYILRQANIRRGYELLMFAQRSEKRGLSQVLQDVLTISSRDGEKIHAAQKPTALYELLLRMSCSAGEKVLDPCCGSGTIFHAAQIVKVSATGIEQDAGFAKQCENTLIELAVGADDGLGDFE